MKVRPTARRQRLRQAASQPKHPRPLWVLSDSTGNLATHMLTACLTQFPQATFAIHVRSFLLDYDRIEKALEEARRAAAIVLHAVVSEPAKRLIENRCNQWRLPCCDLTGQFVQFLSATAGVPAVPDADKLHQIDDRYRERIRAIDFTLEHHDGLAHRRQPSHRRDRGPQTRNRRGAGRRPA
jgi:[pyruvate, water dikinase]-phosphate phosphotransferase / [pyruvate, water dikinase] kinase